MSFFITSAGPGNGANLGGLAGADQHCATLAKAAGSDQEDLARVSERRRRERHAGGQREGPYRQGAVVTTRRASRSRRAWPTCIATPNKLSKENSLSEKGETINGRGDTPNKHDILTGSQLDGTLTASSTCGNWTSAAEDGSASVGHHDRQGGGANPTSWNFAHASKGCGQGEPARTGGDGLYYCFAID